MLPGQTITGSVVSGVIVVGSFAVLFSELASPPPETVALFVKLLAAEHDTSTVKVISGKLADGPTESLRVQLSVAGPAVPPAGILSQVQPGPDSERAINP